MKLFFCYKCGGNDLFCYYDTEKDEFIVRCESVSSYIYKELEWFFFLFFTSDLSNLAYVKERNLNYPLGLKIREKLHYLPK